MIVPFVRTLKMPKGITVLNASTVNIWKTLTVLSRFVYN
jgi:hypothetical protein